MMQYKSEVGWTRMNSEIRVNPSKRTQYKLFIWRRILFVSDMFYYIFFTFSPIVSLIFYTVFSVKVTRGLFVIYGEQHRI